MTVKDRDNIVRRFDDICNSRNGKLFMSSPAFKDSLIEQTKHEETMSRLENYLNDGTINEEGLKNNIDRMQELLKTKFA